MLKFIDAYVDLNGEINLSVLTSLFSVHRTKASKVISLYKQQAPSNLRYDLSAKSYLKTLLFNKEFLSEDSFRYITAIELIFNSEQ